MKLSLMDYLNQLEQYMQQYLAEGICIAFSGGVDSCLLLSAACMAAKKHNCTVLAVTFHTFLHPSSDLEECRKLAGQFGAQYKVIELNEFSNVSITKNPVDRCYHCKKQLFTALIKTAEELGFQCCMDGSNYDDLSEYRPGMRALKELSIKSPLLELKITKETVRLLAAQLNVSTYNKPSAPCLATRLPYGTPFDFALIRRIEKGESILKKYGFYNIRLRLHSDIARIEIDTKDFEIFLQRKEDIIRHFKELGFLYITLDLEGFRSGSMDIGLEDKITK